MGMLILKLLLKVGKTNLAARMGQNILTLSSDITSLHFFLTINLTSPKNLN